jgi:hypothetical protein
MWCVSKTEITHNVAKNEYHFWASCEGKRLRFQISIGRRQAPICKVNSVVRGTLAADNQIAHCLALIALENSRTSCFNDKDFIELCDTDSNPSRLIRVYSASDADNDCSHCYAGLEQFALIINSRVKTIGVAVNEDLNAPYTWTDYITLPPAFAVTTDSAYDILDYLQSVWAETDGDLLVSIRRVKGRIQNERTLYRFDTPAYQEMFRFTLPSLFDHLCSRSLDTQLLRNAKLTTRRVTTANVLVHKLYEVDRVTFVDEDTLYQLLHEVVQTTLTVSTPVYMDGLLVGLAWSV